MKKIFLTVFLLWFLFSFGCFEFENQSAHGSAHLYPDQLEINTNGEDRLNSAKALLDLSPVTVISKPENSLVSNPRTYLSMACYWWPDPNSQDGTPYIRKDGKVNPETRSDKSDLPKMIEMAQRVETLTNAYKMSGEEEFANKAIEQLLTWFVDDNTAMYPHLEHAQMVKGRNSGRSYGVIDTWWLVRVIESIPELRNSDYWSDEIELGLRAWFTHYLNWLRNSDFGQTEMQSKNNHGTWYDLQVVTFARFVNQNDFAVHHLEEVTRSRIARQITLSGRQKYETRRPRPLHYSIYNLSGLMKLVLHGKELGVDLKNNNRWFSGSLEDALDYLINRMDEIDPASLVDEYDQTETDLLYLNLLLDGHKLFQQKIIHSEISRISAP